MSRAVCLLGTVNCLLGTVNSYLPTPGPDASKASPFGAADFPGTNADMVRAAVRLMESDGRAAAAELYSTPEDMAGLFDGLRQAHTASGEFEMALYGSIGVPARNAFSQYYNPLTKEGFVYALPEDSAGAQASHPGAPAAAAAL